MAQDPLAEIVALLARLPGIGERTATRLAFHVLAGESGYAKALGDALAKLHDRVRRCEVCGNFGAEVRCRVCLDPKRDVSTICVVARVQDLVAIERSGSYRGLYHVLHGLLAPLDGVGPDALHAERLAARLRDGEVSEVIVATPLSVEGEATALYLGEILREAGVSVSRIASGVPHGGELDLTDQVTLGRALEGRRRI
jgi:recombination protein RecR